MATAVVRPPSGRPPRARARVRLVVDVRALRHQQRLVRDVHVQAGLAKDRAVALLLESQGEVLAAALDDAALGQHVDVVRLDVVEQALVVRDQQHAEVRVEHRVDALGDDAKCVDVEARVGLVEDRHLGLQDGHLEHLEALLLAAREAFVDVARREALVHAQHRHLLAHLVAEVAHRDAALDGVGRVDVGVLVDALELGVERAPDEAGDAQPGDRRRVLEREEEAEPRALVGRELEQVAALPEDLAALDHVRRVAHQCVREGRLARAVGAHDRVDLALGRPSGRSLAGSRGRAWRRARPRRSRITRSSSVGGFWSVTVRSGLLGAGSGLRRDHALGARGRPGSSIRGSPVTASRTRTHSRLTVQREARSQTRACSGSSVAQNIGAMGPSSARRTSLIVIASGGRASS